MAASLGACGDWEGGSPDLGHANWALSGCPPEPGGEEEPVPRWLEPDSLGEQCGLRHWAESTLKAQLRMGAELEAMLKEADAESTEENVSMGKAPCLECSENAHSHADPPGRGLDDSSLGKLTSPQRSTHVHCHVGVS